MALYSTNAFNSIVNPLALHAIGWKYVGGQISFVWLIINKYFTQYVVYCGLLALELVFVMGYIVETKGDLIVFCLVERLRTFFFLFRSHSRRNCRVV